MLIPFHRPVVFGQELEFIQEAIHDGHISGDGKFGKKCEDLLQKELNVYRVLLTTSGTHALELISLLLDIKTGDEVILPAFTFVSVANAFRLRGARPVFIDVRPDTLNLNEELLENLITPRTKAIVAVHYAGVACEMNVIQTVAAKYDIPVVEDNAHGIFARYRDKPLGGIGDLGALSFHESKNITCGEGGALLVNDARFAERAEIMREKGTNRSSFFRGEIDKYTWVDLGSSYVLSEILAAFLYGQLQSRRTIQARRKRLWHYYYDHLQKWSSVLDVKLPFVPAHCEPSHHIFYLLMPTLRARQQMIQHLKARGISSVFHYLPLHLSRFGKLLGGKEGDCPVTEDVSDRLLRLPLYTDMTECDQQAVVQAVSGFAYSSVA